MTPEPTNSPTTEHRTNRRTGVLFAMVLAGAMTRLVPHPPNFTAVPALALFAGAMFRSRWLALAAPLLAMALSDIVICTTIYGIGALTTVPPMYLAVALTVALGRGLGRSLGGVVLGGLGATLAFFLITNGCVWLAGELYPRTLAGLVACYLAAVPFAVNLLASAWIYGLGFLLLWRVAERRWPTLAEAEKR